MEMKEKIQNYYKMIDQTFLQQFGFSIKETTFLKIVNYLHEPKDSSSLAVTRILFGVAMLFDIAEERGGAMMTKRWGDEQQCHFPLLPFIVAMPMPYMAVVYAAMWLGAVGIMLGYKYRTSAVMFTVCYWYLFLIEKSYWNNHSYLFGLVALLLSCTQANCYWSVDAYLDPSQEKQTVPYWNYFLLKYQFFILYFMAGMKKGTAEWLDGYSVIELSEHWVFDPFKLFLTVPQIDYLIVHCFIFVFDLTVAIWMMWERTRHVAMVFCAMFHLMNTRLFRIGMFPWVCLATMPLFYPFDWPKIVGRYIKELYFKIKALVCSYVDMIYNRLPCNCKTKEMNEDKNNELENSDGLEQHEIGRDDKYTDEEIVKDKKFHSNENSESEDTKQDGVGQDKSTDKDTVVTEKNETEKPSFKDNSDKDDKSENAENMCRRKNLTACLIFFYVFIQAFLPYSHFITKGYNNWTNGLYGYSWDMMVHSWYQDSIIIKIVDNENGEEYYIDPFEHSPNERWTRHGDMVYQYARCINQNLLKKRAMFPNLEISENLSIYLEIWMSMNGRFTQRLFDSKVDLLKASWSPFERVSYLMPMLDEALHWRETLRDITQEVYSWSNNSHVLFLADFPGYELEKYIPEELSNVTLTVLEGVISYQPEASPLRAGVSYKLTNGDSIEVETEIFHKVINIGNTNAYYMYTYVNETEIIPDPNPKNVKPKLPIFKELYVRFKQMQIFGQIVGRSFRQMLFGCDGKCEIY